MWGRQAGAGGVVRADSTMPRPTYPRDANGAVSRPSSRFGQLPPEPVDYTPTEPLLVVEVDTDVCFEPGPMAASDGVSATSAQPAGRRGRLRALITT